ncbi:unnamed protein product [Brassica oleracea var. botrytis]|uniref:Uncharacterized protein n=1 Tax=Brassica oleracea TaxID=3712 RepID=A0A3P6EEW0_BRAOL|nr:unnamed protein product [Brassica oleracea]
MADAAVERLIKRVTKSGFQAKSRASGMGEASSFPKRYVFWFWIKIGSGCYSVSKASCTHILCTQLLFTQLSYPHLPCPHT